MAPEDGGVASRAVPRGRKSRVSTSIVWGVTDSAVRTPAGLRIPVRVASLRIEVAR